MRVPLDFPSLAGPVARALLGDPNPKLSTAAELRYGEHGRLSVRLAGERAGQWFDFRDGRGGGVLDLVIHEHQASDRAGAVRWLEAEGFTDPARARQSESAACPGMTTCGVPVKAEPRRTGNPRNPRGALPPGDCGNRPVRLPAPSPRSISTRAASGISRSAPTFESFPSARIRAAFGFVRWSPPCALSRARWLRCIGRTSGRKVPARRTLNRPRRCSVRVAAVRCGSDHHHANA